MAKPPSDIGRFEEAWRWFREHAGLNEREVAALTKRAIKRAFQVAGLAELRLVDDVAKEIERAIRDGTTLEDFKVAVKEKLERAWAGTVANPPARMETIFRTNLQTAYSAGRVRELMEPEVREGRPFWRFDALLDMRTTELCRVCNGTILPANSGWFHTHTPPLHYGCRSFIQSLTQDDATERGISHQTTAEQPQDGFGSLHALEHWEPDLNGIDSDLEKTYRAKQ